MQNELVALGFDLTLLGAVRAEESVSLAGGWQFLKAASLALEPAEVKIQKE